jgi:hypothetical protein
MVEVPTYAIFWWTTAHKLPCFLSFGILLEFCHVCVKLASCHYIRIVEGSVG